MAHGRASAARAFYFVNIQSLAERPTMNDRDGALSTSISYGSYIFSLEFADQFSCGKPSEASASKRRPVDSHQLN